MEIEQRPLKNIIPYAGNPRKNEAAILPVADSIREFGFRQPLVIDKEGVIIVGHTRFQAAQLLKLTEVPVHIATDLTPDQIRAYRLADNKTSEFAEWDEAQLIREIEALKNSTVNVHTSAFTPEEIAAFELAVQQLKDKADRDPDVITESVESEQPITAYGDVWLCGIHRVMCGDATKAEDIDALIENEIIDLGITDPPYNINYEGFTDKKLKIKNDNLSPEAFEALLRDALLHYERVLHPRASLYIFHSVGFQALLERMIKATGFTIRNQLMWLKNHFTHSLGRYHHKHELIFYAHKTGESDRWYGDKQQTTVLEAPKPLANRLHPTMKPVLLIEKILKNSSQVSDTVLDLFGGSGSTLIACERLARKARVLELSPQYVDVIVERWEAWTGKKAIHATTKKPFFTGE